MKTRELYQRLKITPRMLEWWRNHRLVSVSFISGVGAYGFVCDFDETEALLVAIIAEFRQKGMSLDQIRKCRLKASAITGDFLVISGRKALYCTEAELLPAVEASPRGCYVVCLSDLRARLTAPVKERRAAA